MPDEKTNLRLIRNFMSLAIREAKADTFLSRIANSILDDTLAAGRVRGKYGWWDDHVCCPEYLANEVIRCLTKNDLNSAFAFMAMLIGRREIFGDTTDISVHFLNKEGKDDS